ncbi:MAG: hypothetical protein OXU86_01125 [Thaumarchaeota archaeon]|nr:hypothetical protein [Nitrososphaerota archaeon]
MASASAPRRAGGHRGVTVAFWIVVPSVIILAVSLVKKWDDGSFVLSLISFLVLVYAVFTACKANLAQARRDKSEIKNAHALIRQCRATLKGIDIALRDMEFERAYLLLDQLHGRVGLFLTKYGSYMQPEAADIVWEMENSITSAKTPQGGDHRLFIDMMRESLDAMQENILDVDDPAVRDPRSKMQAA